MPNEYKNLIIELQIIFIQNFQRINFSLALHKSLLAISDCRDRLDALNDGFERDHVDF